MSNSKTNTETQTIDSILNFVTQSKGLRVLNQEVNFVQIHQEIDGKVFKFNSLDVNDVIPRVDSEGKAFIQINFTGSNKVLFTDTLVGFKPIETLGLDMSRLPKVVTTPDLQSVFEAVEEALSGEGVEHEVEILKKVYQSILLGAERVGFTLHFERVWLNRLLASGLKVRASA